jgi:predicted nucleic acid-binding protein
VRAVLVDTGPLYALFIRCSDQPITLFDALLATLSAELSLPVWTYDKHFDVMKAEIWR